MKILLTLLAVFLLFSGCSSDKKMVVAEKKELPSWLNNPPSSSNGFLYAVGEGQNKEEAVANALSSMVSTLSVSISSKFSAKSVVKEGYNSSNQATYTNEIQSDVKKIRISNYELVDSKNIGYKKEAVLIKSNKKELFESLVYEIEQNFSLIEQKKSTLASSNAIKKLVFYKETQESLSSLNDTLLVMNSLDKNFKGENYLSHAQRLDKEYETLLLSVSFGVESNNDASRLVSSITKALSEKKFKVSNSNNANHFRVILTSNTVKASSYGFTLARSAIDISIKDANGAVIGSNKLNITGQSTQGYPQAKENVAMKLSEMIKKEGIEKVIGLSI
jgi:hypothetical protein